MNLDVPIFSPAPPLGMVPPPVIPPLPMPIFQAPKKPEKIDDFTASQIGRAQTLYKDESAKKENAKTAAIKSTTPTAKTLEGAAWGQT